MQPLMSPRMAGMQGVSPCRVLVTLSRNKVTARRGVSDKHTQAARLNLLSRHERQACVSSKPQPLMLPRLCGVQGCPLLGDARGVPLPRYGYYSETNIVQLYSTILREICQCRESNNCLINVSE
jgi:hypothetical protein